jgi:nitrite reductase (NADH) small subunit
LKHRLFALDELEPGQMRSVRADGISIVVARTAAGRVHALRDICAHMGAKLSNGYLQSTVLGPEVGAYELADDQFVIRCPWHGYEYDVGTGRCLADPEHARVRAYEVTVEDGVIYFER